MLELLMTAPWGGPHTDVEWVDLASVQTCADVLVATARSFCG